MRSSLLKVFTLFFLNFFPPISISSSAAAVAPTTLPNCLDKCGNITIPYPFGMSADCYRSSGFYIACNASYDPPRALLSTTNIELTDISLSDATATILTPIARDCYAPLGLGPDINSIWTDVSGLPYAFSHTRNKFTALGCDTVALNFEYNVLDYSSGCVSFCDGPSSIANGTCSGIGCCQTSIPKGMHRVYTILRSLRNHTTTWNVSPCSYAFVVDQERFVFDLTDLHGFYSKNRGKVPAVMDWAIGNATCDQVNGTETFSCGANSYCVDNDNGPGYRCNCSSGYQGNPYLANGCQDIDECADPDTNPCAGICENTPGSYACSCPQGYYGDGKKSGSGCIQKTKRFPLIQVVLGSGLSFLFLLVSGSWLYWMYRKRRLIQLKEKFFKQNGGLLLQQQIASHEGAAESAARIFTAEELKAATDDYSESRVLGRGGYGTVYKGVLPGGRVVAIKKSMVVDRTQIEQFVNEVVLLSQVIHKNVVRLLGCCLETPVPLLVYEFVSHGTLHHHIHGAPSSLSWEARLRIAAETSAALAYLHSAISRPIFHRDVKSANILLDDNYMAKVADFGASRLVPLDRTQITTLVQGTLGYLDPEYFQTGQLTEKSDVYSFGVVLAELLTGQRPLSQQRPEEERNLAIHFLLHMRENRLFRMVEPRVRSEGRREQLSAVAELAQRCLRLRGEERPEMREVAAELERARKGWTETATEDAADAEEETRYYTGAPVAPVMINTTGDVELDEHILLSLEMRR